MNSTLCEEQEVGNKIYSSEELALIDPSRIPSHIAIIMDGNRRFAKKHHLPLMVGHWKGADTLTKIVKAAIELNVKTLTVWAFSTENWKRPKEEVQFLMHILQIFLIQKRDFMMREGVRLETIGDTHRLSDEIKEVLDETKQITKRGDKIDLVVAINYGARDDIRRAMHAIIEDCLAGKIAKEEVTEAMISKYLDTAKWKDPDFLIRTSGEMRLSNFLLWQLSYSEVYVTDVLWPEFDEKDFFQAILEYQNRKRRFGL
ncbi:MAG TPA: isoprenyl transferase [Rhabdochlamydiaceae bacterium]|nr:isoprenyl transferase [Rhabdochlamydiaceae bacterium]